MGGRKPFFLLFLKGSRQHQRFSERDKSFSLSHRSLVSKKNNNTFVSLYISAQEGNSPLHRINANKPVADVEGGCGLVRIPILNHIFRSVHLSFTVRPLPPPSNKFPSPPLSLPSSLPSHPFSKGGNNVQRKCWFHSV